MIESFRHKGLKRFFTKNDSSKLPAEQVAKIRYILTRLNVAKNTQDMNYGGSGFHQLSGDLKLFYVDYLDYH